MGFNNFFKVWPILFLANKLFTFIEAQMPSQLIDTIPIDKLCLKNFGYKW